MKKDGMRLVCVVMGADDPKLRNSDAMAILNYGFNAYDLLILKDKGEIVDRTNDTKHKTRLHCCRRRTGR